MAVPRLFAIGGSAGAIEVLREIVGQLPADFSVPIVVVVHVSADSPGLLPEILSAAGPLRAQHAGPKDRIAPGRIYVARPDHHLLLISQSRFELSSLPKENRFRPAIDPLFASVARHFGPTSVGVLLSGGLSDGTNGLDAIKRAGGQTIVQSPESAFAPSMPRSALDHVAIDYCLPPSDIAATMIALAVQ